MPEQQIVMKYCILVCLVLTALPISTVESSLSKDFLSEQVKPWYGIVIHRFYGPWNVLRKRNGDYVDYNDYGTHIQESQPSSLDLTYDSLPISEGYLNEVPRSQGDGLSGVNSDYEANPIGLAIFRTGMRNGENIDDTREVDATTSPEEDLTSSPINDEGH